MAPADVPSDVLRSLRASGTFYTCDHLVAPWSKAFADSSNAPGAALAVAATRAISDLSRVRAAARVDVARLVADPVSPHELRLA